MRWFLIVLLILAALLSGLGFWASKFGAYTVMNTGEAPLEVTFIATRCEKADLVRTRLLVPGDEETFYFPVSSCEGGVSILTPVSGCGLFDEYVESVFSILWTGYRLVELDVAPDRCQVTVGP